MEQNRANQPEPRSDSPDKGAAGSEGDGYGVAVRRVTAGETGAYSVHKPTDPIAQVLQEILAVPQRILPEQTYTHLKNAAKEAALALFSLANHLSGGARSSGGKSIRHIDVE